MHSSACLLYQSGGFARKAETLSEESPFLMPVLPKPAYLAGFPLALRQALDGLLALAPSLLPAAFPLSERGPPVLALLASSVGTFRRVMIVPESGRSRLASMPAATSRGSTSLVRLPTTTGRSWATPCPAPRRRPETQPRPRACRAARRTCRCTPLCPP